ncbi:MAG TPA: hypothetical protein VLT59_15220 [Steroidobacteraceae bacterium]|nr:hypothetical protein [Steroidobacteraceae bacterium]
MSQADWLTLNAQRAYPFIEGPFTTTGGDFPGNEVFADLGFTPGIASYFEPGRDSIYLDRYYTDGTDIHFFFRVSYGAGAEYEAMACYEWVFSFPLNADIGTTVYSIATQRPLNEFDFSREREAPEMGLAFMACGRLSVLALAPGGNHFTDTPTVEPALIKSDARAYVNGINIANEARPCPDECPCPESSSSSSSSGPVTPSSSSSSSAFCEPDPAPEPVLQSAPLRLALPRTPYTGAIKVKSGYNMQVSVIAAQNAIKFDALVNAGSGMQCEDLRIELDGEPVHESCQTCGGLVYGINGHGYPAEHLQLVGEKGVVILPDADNHRVFILLEEEGLCRVDI